jgi:pimeloyl-ACP methyl ester carboxylesterase
MGMRRAAVLVGLALVAAGTAPALAAGGGRRYPVPYTFAAGIVAQTLTPGAAPPGSNDWHCRVTPAHPRPVVLVHGLAATMTDNWQTISPLLADNGYCVFALTYGRDPGESYVGGVEPMEVSSQELANFVDEVLASTGASKVDLVGHSEGTVMPQYYLKRLGGAPKVNRYVAIAPLYQGTTLYGLSAGINALGTYLPRVAGPIESVVAGQCGSCQEFLNGSPFLTKLYSDGVYAVPGVTYTTIMTRYDELVIPYTSGDLHAPNATNIVLPGIGAPAFP